jgi:hypothetical protein
VTEQPDTRDGVAEELPAEQAEALPVLAEVRALEPAGPAASPAVQAAAVAATGFVAGAVTVAAVRRARTGHLLPRRRRRSKARELGEIVTSRSFLVDIHLLNRE